MGEARVLQANLHHASAAAAVVECCLVKGKASLALIQEPWVANTQVLGLNDAGKILCDNTGMRPRACIVFNKNVDFLPITEVCNSDLVAAFVNLKGWNGARVIMCSAYLPGEKEDPTEDLARVVAYAAQHNAELLIGCDANAHHTSWGSTDTNKRGEVLFDFLITNHLITLNVGCTPTFVTRVRQEVLDITIVTNNLARHIDKWQVSNENSMSDHRHITFEVRAALNTQTTTYRDPRSTDWAGFRNQLAQHLASFPKTIKSTESLEIAVASLTEGIHKAYEMSCPLRTKTSARKVPWWNSRLRKLREKTRALFNKVKKTQAWETYRKALLEYSKAIRKAKRASWRKLCEEIKSLPQSARLHKLLSKANTSQIGLLKRDNGSFTSNEKETLELLAATHFPGSYARDQSHQHMLHRPRNEDWSRAAKIVRPNQVQWAVDSFKPYKACGEDGIIPVLLQQGVVVLLPYLIRIFRASLAWGYIPDQWTQVRVIFIPKAGRKDYSQPKSFRPISLTSFLLKAMEKVLDRYIRDVALVTSPIHSSQHAYCKGKSTETALACLIDKVEKAVEDKEIALCAFLDIEGAFDNSSVSLLVNGLISKNVDSTTTRWIKSMLSHRRVKLALHETKIEVTTVRGCPQGGVLSPLLWTLAVDRLLFRLAELQIDAQGYADDLVIVVRGFCQNTVSQIIQKGLKTVNDWCVESDLSVNADKTIIVPFTKKRRLDKLIMPKLNGKRITFSLEAKYLGVTIDQKLTWNKHLANVLSKAKMALGASGRLMGSNWGVNPKIALWLYTSIVRPIVTYASVAWFNKTDQSTTIKKLDSLQRTACLFASGAMSTCPGMALNALLGLPPLNVFIQKEAKASMYRANIMGRKGWLSKKMRTLQDSLMDLPILGMTPDAMLLRHVFEKQYSVEMPSREDWCNNQLNYEAGCLIWYTDGSKIGRDVGCGIHGERPRFSRSVNLGHYASIFQAEVYAIIECAEANLQKQYTNHTIYINSDSQAALLALDSNVVSSKLVEDCMARLNVLGHRNRVILRWVPGHAGIIGNERADELARGGANGTQQGPEPFCGIPKSMAQRALMDSCFEIATRLWAESPGMVHSKVLIRAYDKRLTTQVRALSRNNLRTVVRALTGHCCLNKHMFNLRLSETRTCRRCGEYDETPLHLLGECGPLIHKRSVHLGKHILSPDEIKELTPKQILQFITAAGFGCDL